MSMYFNINLEFNRDTIHSRIQHLISCSKGYVCVVDGNVLATTYADSKYRDVINGSSVNTCDGSSIALMASKIYHHQFGTYTGPELFVDYTSQDSYKQYFLGNTAEILSSLSVCFKSKGIDTAKYTFQSLPFKNIDDFDYQSIADEINSCGPDLIWVSLGAPKQEQFIAKLFPFIHRGVLFAIGAAFNLYLGEESSKRAPEMLRKLHLEWLYRVVQEPKRVGRRAWNYAKTVPFLFIEEYRKVHEKSK